MTQHLVIRISDNSLSFTQKMDSGDDVCFEPYEVKGGISIAANMRDAFKTSTLLNKSYDRVTVAIDAPYMLVPLDDFQVDEMEEHYRYVFPDSESKKVEMCVLPSFRTIAVFGINKDLKTVLTDHFSEIKLKPIMASLWEYLLKRSPGAKNKKLYAYFHDGKMELCSFARNRFAFTNSYKAVNSNDTLYFILAAWKQIGGAAMTDDLFLAGKFQERELLAEKAKQFLARVYHINPSGDFNRATIAQNPNLPLDLMLEFL